MALRTLKSIHNALVSEVTKMYQENQVPCMPVSSCRLISLGDPTFRRLAMGHAVLGIPVAKGSHISPGEGVPGWRTRSQGGPETNGDHDISRCSQLVPTVGPTVVPFISKMS